ncbi:MAG: hypothetical protein R2788_21675 [Saprospiraceae bacterium]
MMKRILSLSRSRPRNGELYLPHANKLLKVMIVPCSKSLGAAFGTCHKSVPFVSKPNLKTALCGAGDGAAEEVVFGEVTSGALDDLEKVTKQAYTMVAYYGLNKEIGNISF